MFRERGADAACARRGVAWFGLGHQGVMDRSRYEGFVAAKEAVAAQVQDRFVAEALCDLAEGLLLARSSEEAALARRRASETLGPLVDRGEITRRVAGRFWMHLRACGPRMYWPASWARARVSPRAGAVRGN
jgi:hypothetical protein